MSTGPRFGIRLSGGGLVTYVDGEPLTTYEQAERWLAVIERATGETGEIVRAAAISPGQA